MSKLVNPHGGGPLVPRLIAESGRKAALERAAGLKSVPMSSRETSDLVMLAMGAYTPIEGFIYGPVPLRRWRDRSCDLPHLGREHGSAAQAAGRLLLRRSRRCRSPMDARVVARVPVQTVPKARERHVCWPPTQPRRGPHGSSTTFSDSASLPANAKASAAASSGKRWVLRTRAISGVRPSIDAAASTSRPVAPWP